MKKIIPVSCIVIALCSGFALAKQPQQEPEYAWLAEPAGNVSYGTTTGCLVRVSKSLGSGESLQWSGRCEGSRASGEGTLTICSRNGKAVATATGVMQQGEWKEQAIASGATEPVNCHATTGAIPQEEASKMKTSSGNPGNQTNVNASSAQMDGITHILEYKNQFGRTEKLLCSLSGYIRVNLGILHGYHQDFELATLTKLERAGQMFIFQAGDKNQSINGSQVDGFFACSKNSTKCDQDSNDGLLNATNCKTYSQAPMQAYSQLLLPVTRINRLVKFGEVEQREYQEQMAKNKASMDAAKQADADAAMKRKIQNEKRLEEERAVAAQWLSSCKSSRKEKFICNRGNFTLIGPIDAVNRAINNLCPEYTKAGCEAMSDNLDRIGSSAKNGGWVDPGTTKRSANDPLARVLAEQCESEKNSLYAKLSTANIGVRNVTCDEMSKYPNSDRRVSQGNQRVIQGKSLPDPGTNADDRRKCRNVSIGKDSYGFPMHIQQCD